MEARESEVDTPDGGWKPEVMNDLLGEDTANGDDFGGNRASGLDIRAISRGVSTLLLIAIATAFAVQNSESVEVSFLTWDFSLSKILLMVASALVGIGLWLLVGRLLRRQR